MILQLEHKAEHEEHNRADDDEAPLIGEVNPASGRAGLVCKQGHTLGGGADLLRLGVPGHHQAQVENALGNAHREHHHRADQAAGQAIAAHLGLPLHVIDQVAHKRQCHIGKADVAEGGQGGTHIDHHAFAGA